MTNNEYFGKKDIKHFGFIRIPKLLFTDNKFSKLSNDAKLLYSLMLDRMTLSVQNDWFDDDGRVYIIFTVEEAAAVLNCGPEKISRLFSELDDAKGVGLITRNRRGQGKPSVIYLHKFTGEVSDDETSENTVPANRISENQECGKSKICAAENPLSATRISEIQECGKSKCNKTDYNQTDMNKTDFDHPLPRAAAEDQNDEEEIISSVNDRIDYDALCNGFDKNIVTEVRNIIADVIMKKYPVKVNGKIIDSDRASEMFSRAERGNITSVLETMRTSKVHNTAAWLTAAVYNSMLNYPQDHSDNERPRLSEENYYSANPRHDTARIAAPSFDIDLIIEHAKHTPLKVRSR